MNNNIEFTAYIPLIQSAINTGSDGMRIKLDILETDIAQAIKSITLRGKIFRVIIEAI